jgi:hypothetical protein
MPRSIAVCFAGVLGITACSSPSLQEPTTTGIEAIVNGIADTGDPAVVMWDDGNYYCTGALVSPHVVLTAGHCTNSMAVSTTQVYFGSTRSSATTVMATALVTDPMYPTSAPNGADQTNGHDLGVVVLASAGPATPLPMNNTPLTQAMAGQTVRVVGWGRPSPNGTGGDSKLEGTDTWDMFTDYMIHFGAGPQHECNGDSGGPALQTIDGCEVIIGTVSFHTDNACMDGWYNRVDNQQDFIDHAILQYDPGYTLPCPSNAASGSSSGGGSSSSGAGSSSGAAAGSSSGSTSGAGSGSSTGSSGSSSSSGGESSGTGGSGSSGVPSSGSSGGATAGGTSSGSPGGSASGGAGGSSSGSADVFDSEPSAGCACVLGGARGADARGAGLLSLAAAIAALVARRRRPQTR